ncbi:serine/threonine-protein kinase [Kitasatospora sp. NPDC051170]|uniref:serine/threonine-protein kinase n=1 Tax=Kitasatospora sp. NPDC051170 TaxID=3364056 RepID=UPI0037ABE567
MAERYVMDRPMGAGGMGEVWAAEDRLLGRRVAVKLLHETDAESRERFLREARAVAGLQHPGIVVVHDFGEVDDMPYLVMELLAGRSLEARRDDGPVAVGWAAEVGAQVAQALAVAHAAGLVHRDVKPSNLFLTEDGAVKLLDFGLVHERPQAVDDSGPTDRTTAVGTRAYMAPEQYTGRSVDARADLYALGGTLHALLTRLPPTTEGPPLRELRPDVPKDLAQLITELLRPDPAQRPAAAGPVAERLRHLAERHGGRRAPKTVRQIPVARDPRKAQDRKQLARRGVIGGVASLAFALAAVKVIDLPYATSDSSVTPGWEPNHPTATALPAQLQPGDCLTYTRPTGAPDAYLDTNVDAGLGWTRLDCTRPHQGQVVKVLTLTDPAFAAKWPTALNLLSSDCFTAVTAVTSAHPSLSLSRAVLGPTKTDWLSGAGHFAYCTVHPRDDADLTTDVRPAAGPQPSP